MHHGQVGFESRIGQVLVKRKQLSGSEHTLVDNDPGGQTAGVKLLGFCQCGVQAQGMGETLANHIQLALEIFLAETTGSTDEQLLDLRLRHARRRAHIGTLGIDGYLAPAYEVLTFFHDDGIDDLATLFALGLVLGQEDIADGVMPGCRQLGAELFLGYLVEKTVGQGHQDAGAIAGIGFEPAAAAMVHPGVQVVGIQHDLVAGFSLYIGDKSNTAGIFLKGRVVQSSLFGEAKSQRFLDFFAHSKSLVLCFLSSPLWHPYTTRCGPFIKPAVARANQPSDAITNNPPA